jgi:Family of unknown function (DUF6282)
LISGIVDWHVHASPSIVPRRGDDREMWQSAQAAGVAIMVLKAHEGSSVERAILAGSGVVGGVVLNSTVGGPNPDAVRLAAQLGGRVVWMPTISAEAHCRAAGSPELSAHRGVRFRPVPVVVDGRLLPAWHEVLDEVAAGEMVLVAGHLMLDETVVLFKEARRHGVQRLLVNHPSLSFLGWRDEHAEQLLALDVRLEVGVTCDLICGESGHQTPYFAERYPTSLLVFGSDLGHVKFPAMHDGYASWISTNEQELGEDVLRQIMTENGRELLA